MTHKHEPYTYSSVGRAAVSKTAGRGFEPLCPCHRQSKAISVAPFITANKCRIALVFERFAVYVATKQTRGASGWTNSFTRLNGVGINGIEDEPFHVSAAGSR